VARRKHALEGVAAAARERGAPDVLVVPADVSDPEQSRRAVEETVAHFGKCTLCTLSLDYLSISCCFSSNWIYAPSSSELESCLTMSASLHLGHQ